MDNYGAVTIEEVYGEMNLDYSNYKKYKTFLSMRGSVFIREYIIESIQEAVSYLNNRYSLGLSISNNTLIEVGDTYYARLVKVYINNSNISSITIEYDPQINNDDFFVKAVYKNDRIMDCECLFKDMPLMLVFIYIYIIYSHIRR